MRFDCLPTDAAFFENAPRRFVNAVEVPASAEAVFASFERGGDWPKWFPGIRGVQWTSPSPFGVGTTRTVTLDTITVHEHFFEWSPGRSFSFHFVGASLPLFVRFAERYVLEPLDGARCRYTHTVALEPTLLLKLLWPIASLQFGSQFRTATAQLAARFADGTLK